MDLTPQLFRDVQFTERRGAYDREEVDAFLARVGTAVGQLQERLRDAQRRVEAAEEHASRLESSSRDQHDANETLQRTLVLAQRTADAAVAEAKEEAERIVADARHKGDQMIAQAEEAVRRDVGATRDRLEAEIGELQRHRDDLVSRIGVVDSHFQSERTRLAGELDALKAVLEDPSRAGVSSVPGDDPEPPETLRRSHAGGEAPVAATEPPPAPALIPDAPALTDEPGQHEVDLTDDEDLSHLPPPPVDWDASSASAESADEPPAWADDPRAGVDDAGGPPTEATPVIGAGTSFGGSHLDELRRAVSEEPTDAEADAAMAAFFDQDEAERNRRFGRRR